MVVGGGCSVGTASHPSIDDKATMQQQSRGTVAIRKDVQTPPGRWAKQLSPEYLAVTASRRVSA